eukprot:CAMPEP_0197197664 /NCGR_PEP_ID=MMETSP1423-20130617/32982_1 /TAXON_ID=476441 /ORGANISM="Pseudo-nitzschia heimii, Strain UNC1101" /LENGTH=306 /DNA_ID=CAMNT_0042651489 /DNA_START=98 /DNA_END=1018 /DNA_ORIENTATION=+
MSTKSTATTTDASASAKRKNESGDTAATADPPPKKAKKIKTKSKLSTTKKKDEATTTDGFKMLKVADIRAKLEELCDRVPVIPEGNFLLPSTAVGDDDVNKEEPAIDETATREWVAQLQVVLEEFNLCVCCVGTATYKWGTERSGAGDQNLSLLLGEVSSSQEQISTAVTPRLTNLLAPVVDLVIEKTVTRTATPHRDPPTPTTTATTTTTTTAIPGSGGGGDAGSSRPPSSSTETSMTVTEVKENHFARKLVDPAFLKLCHKILARNAPLLRHVVLSNFHKLLAAMKDFLKAQVNDAQHSRSFAY